MNCARPNIGLRILDAETGGPAHRAGIRKGDLILEMNGEPVRDELDYRFHAADGEADFRVRRKGGILSFRVRAEEGRGFGLEFPPMDFRACGNHCLFCFSDQNPPGMRPSLYFKDEDYRLSFLFGNYVTLTAVREPELQRIARQRLSPLYISIHSVSGDVRRKLLGIQRDDRLLDKIRFLAEAGIEMHGQIVLCPGINDGETLRESVETLRGFYPSLKSLAIVPVGLTRHRKNLPSLNGVDGNTAMTVMEMIEPFQERFGSESDSAFVYLSDEWYLLAGRDLPDEAHYAGFWQSDNGVGLTRRFLSDLEAAVLEAGPFEGQPSPRLWITGTLAAPVLEKYAVPLLASTGVEAEILPVRNRFFGASVTVTGLLTAQDILSACRDAPPEAVILLPSVCLNEDGLFLDDMTLADFTVRLGRRVVLLENLEDFWKS
jgi:putative radical SAM enzyme (TIGR03279 family)